MTGGKRNTEQMSAEDSHYFQAVLENCSNHSEKKAIKSYFNNFIICTMKRIF